MPFDIPQRQSPFALVLILYRTYLLLLKQIWPFAIYFIIKGNFGSKGSFLKVFIASAVVIMIISIIRYFRFKYSVVDREFIIEKGILNRKKTAVSIDKIQSINSEQNLIHQLFGIEKLRIETAGSSALEFELDAINTSKARELKSYLLESRIPLINDDSVMAPIDKKLIFKLSTGRLMLAGITQNHLVSILILFSFFFWIYDSARDAGINVEDYKDNIPDYTTQVTNTFILLALLFVTGILISMARTALKYYDLSFIEENEQNFKVKAGLLKRMETSAPINKIQSITWSYNLLQKPFNLYNLNIRQAVSDLRELKRSVQIIGLNKCQIENFSQELYPDLDISELTYETINVKYLTRFRLYFMLIILLGILLYFLIDGFISAIVLVLIGGYGILRTYLYYLKMGFRLDKNYLVLTGGIFGYKLTILPLYRIQAIKLLSTPYQRRNQLASLEIWSASGYVKIPYIPTMKARQISDYCLFVSEISQKSWM